MIFGRRRDLRQDPVPYTARCGTGIVVAMFAALLALASSLVALVALSLAVTTARTSRTRQRF